MEITTQILSQLHVKSLLRFKCVSKSWKTIIESPEFFKLHLKRAVKINYYNSSYTRNLSYCHDQWFPYMVRALYRAYLNLNDTKLNISKVSLPPSFDKSLESITIYKNYHINRPEKLVFGKNEVAGSCNGLVLIVSGINHIVVCNPALDQEQGSFKVLPCINYCYAPYYYNAHDCHERSYWLSNGIRNYTAIRYFRFRVFGLGYDCISHCFKVVGLTAKRALIYTLLKDGRSWREINLPVLNNSFVVQPGNSERKLFIKVHNHGIAANNQLHWHITEYDPLIFGYSKEKILNFDLHTEKWGELAVPDELNEGYYLYGYISKGYIIVLGMLNGCLCILISRGISYDYLELWVMKVYGVKNSWEKLCNLPNGSGIPLVHRKEQQEFPVPGAQHGLGWYNLKEKRIRKVEFHGCEFTGEHYYSTSKSMY